MVEKKVPLSLLEIGELIDKERARAPAGRRSFTALGRRGLEIGNWKWLKKIVKKLAIG